MILALDPVRPGLARPAAPLAARDRRHRVDRLVVLLRLPRQPPAAAGRARIDAKGVGGELWSVHGGGFYHVQRYRLAPRRLPETLHFFKWEAYTTCSPLRAARRPLLRRRRPAARRPRCRRPARRPRSHSSIGLLVAAWIVYDLLCRLLAASEELLAAGRRRARGSRRRLGHERAVRARAAYLQVGAMLGTIMAANVLFSIILAHSS